MKRWIRKGSIVCSELKTTQGNVFTIHEIMEVYMNTVLFTDGTTQQKHLLSQIKTWVSVKEYKCPIDREVLCLDGCDEWMIGYYSYETGFCENEHELLRDVLYWMPRQELED